MSTALTSKELRISNRRKVLMDIYHKKSVSKRDLEYDLLMSLPTVTQNLNELLKIGIITYDGVCDSTGGRKAIRYRFCNEFKIAIGIDMQEYYYLITAVDLFGDIIDSIKYDIPYERSESYRATMRKNVEDFIRKVSTSKDQLLGVAIGLQGLVSSDAAEITYGKISDNQGLTVDDFFPDFPYPCKLMHDIDAAALAELWDNPEIDNAILIRLTNNVGGAVIVGRHILTGKGGMSNAIEHVTIHPDGIQCYCGKNGCAESYLSGKSLSNISDMPIEQFLEERTGNIRCQMIWNKFLTDIALLFSDLRILFDYDFIIGGYIAEHISDEEIELLCQNCNEQHPFKIGETHILRSKENAFSVARGAGLTLVKSFIDSSEV